MTRLYSAIGLMSGTSLDGIDAALIETDGHTAVRPLDFLTIPYEDTDRQVIRAAYGLKDRTAPAARMAQDLSTQLHIKAVQALLAKTGRKIADIDLIGYHGQTIYHAPLDGITIQLSDGQAMAKALGIPVIYDMRANDVAQGGQGAPLAPLYHWARMKSANVPMPAVILNIGGIGNITYLGNEDGDILAFDTGPGNALMDDWMQKRTGARYDEDGQMAASGRIAQTLLDEWLDLPYFSRRPPKSLDRDEWPDVVEQAQALSDADGAATLMALTAESIILSRAFMPTEPKAWYVGGGGRHNKALMKYLKENLTGSVQGVDVLGWNGDAIEAECFAYLGVRSKLGLPLSLPTTTGVKSPMTGGVLANP